MFCYDRDNLLNYGYFLPRHQVVNIWVVGGILEIYPTENWLS